uniref:Apoptosis inhibitor 5 n=1 Tax=Phallusia mammillata TaxID=59560 RepID=A0A6F9D735_9ASCI|nr:apoptosis inhibitor 5 [Phallusia mammillata]
MNKETEEYVLAEAKKIMEDVTGDEFQILMQGLASLHHLQTIQGRQQMVDIIAEQMNLEDEFKVSDPDSVNRISQCVGMAMPLCSRNVHASRFVNYLCQKVLPTLTKEEATNGQDTKESSPKDRKLELMKQLAEMSLFCGNGTNIIESIEPVFEKLLEYMPLPPDDPESNGSITVNPKLQFSYVECLMFAFHQMGKHKADFLTSEEAAERLKDFRLRLQYFARGLQVYIKQLRASLHGKSPSQLRSEPENQIKIVALKTCNNVNTLIKDLFHNPPAYKATVQVSWKKPASPTTVTKPDEAKARKRSSTGGDGVELKKKTERTIYRAPGGKYSSNISQRGAFGGRGRGRGNRGGNRRWSGGKKF